jgi:hypothetical protein
MPRLFPTARQAWDADDGDTRADHWQLPGDIAPDSGEPVVIYCDYGDGGTWPGMATRDYVTSELNWVDIDDATDCNFVQPRWVRWE